MIDRYSKSKRDKIDKERNLLPNNDFVLFEQCHCLIYDSKDGNTVSLINLVVITWGYYDL